MSEEADMKRKVIAFDLDDTLAVTKSPISERMSGLLGKLLEKYEVCIISGGKYELFQTQVVEKLSVSEEVLPKLHLMPTCGTTYYRYDQSESGWKRQYAEDLTEEEKVRIREALEKGARQVGLWEEETDGEPIEDRGSQMTLSSLGQLASPEKKYAWAEKNAKKRYELRDAIAALIPDLEVRVAGTTSTDVTHSGLDKAYGMNKLMEILDIPKEGILFIGDKLEEGGNDYPVKAAGIDTIAVRSWEDTAYVLEGILGVSQ